MELNNAMEVLLLRIGGGRKGYIGIDRDDVDCCSGDNGFLRVVSGLGMWEALGILFSFVVNLSGLFTRQHGSFFGRPRRCY